MYLAARPSMGKTALALNMAHRQTFEPNHFTVLFFSLEMSGRKLSDRLIGIEGGISLTNIVVCDLTETEYDKLPAIGDSFGRARLYINDRKGISVAQMKAAARKLRSEIKALDLIIIDQLNFIKPRPESRKRNTNDMFGDISRDLKNLAGDINCPVICLHQLNRELTRRDNKRPVLPDLRDSGNLEQDADHIVFIHRPIMFDPKADSQLAEIIYAKGRDRETGMVELNFIKGKGRFESRRMI